VNLLMNYDERERTPILIDVGYLSTELSVVDNDAIVYHAVLPMGGGHMTAALAEALEMGKVAL
jgi:cell division ATPase FtsA